MIEALQRRGEWFDPTERFDPTDRCKPRNRRSFKHHDRQRPMTTGVMRCTPSIRLLIETLSDFNE